MHAIRDGLRWLRRQRFRVRTVLDVGASDGRWSLECMKHFPDADYVLFEPQPVHSDALDSFARSHPNTLAIKKAVGASEGYTFFDASDPFGGALAHSDEAKGTISVELTTIDASVSQTQHKGPYLLKLDTHGFEKSILDGARNTLSKAGILVIEAYNHRITAEALLFWELCTYLFEQGFRPIGLMDVAHRPFDHSLWQMDLLFIRSEWPGFRHIEYQ